MIDHDQIAARYEGDEDLIRAVCEAFIGEQPELILDLEKALSDQSREQVRKAAHALKGSALNVGAIEFSERARSLEVSAMSIDWAEIEALVHQLSRDSESSLTEIRNRYLSS